MFEHFSGDLWHDIHLLLSWWAVLGFFGACLLPAVRGDKKVARFQWFLLGPFFWIGVPLLGLFFLARNKGQQD